MPRAVYNRGVPPASTLMMPRLLTLSLLVSLTFGLCGFHAEAAEPFRFEDVTESSGIAAVLEKMPGKRSWRYAHGAAWGDVDGDGRPDLFAGAFAGRPYYKGDDAPLPNVLLLQREGKFSLVDDETLQARDGNARCAGALFVDLDGDGDLDLVVANHVQNANQGRSKLFENLGGGKFRDATPDAAPWTSPLGMRNIAALDVNDDGRLDLILADGSYGKQAVEKAQLLVLANRGKFQFEPISSELGLPANQTTGLGLALGDVNDDGRPDIFVAGSNRLFVTGPDGKFREAHPGRFAFPPADRAEGLHCGAAFGDLNQDGLLDLVTSEHGVPARLHVFHNRGVNEGLPDLVEVSKEVGLGEDLPPGTRARPIKTAHIFLRDVDNDGRLDLMTTLIADAGGGKVQPVVLRNESERGGPIRLSPLPRERLVGYFAPGPVADYDRDGRVDIFLPTWFEDLPNYLFHNVTKGGNWLTVRVRGGEKRNGMGIGAVAWVYESGHLGDAKHLLGRADITIGNGYASGEEALAHLGLGPHSICDLRITWRGQTTDQKGVAANQLLTIAP